MKINRLVFGVPVPEDIDRRRGRFESDMKLVEHEFEAVARLMRNVVVMRAECMMQRHSIEYHGVSPYFEVVEKMSLVPIYIPTVTTEFGKIVKVEWQKATGDPPNPYTPFDAMGSTPA